MIEAGLSKDGNYWTLIDTAGLRETDNVIEQEGMRRSLREAELADIIVLIYDCSRALSKQEQGIYDNLIIRHPDKIILVGNKSDLGEVHHNFSMDLLTISTKTGTKIELLEKKIADHIAQLFDRIASPFLLNQRQYKLVITLEQKLTELQTMMQQTVQHELLAYHLKDALALIGELTGKSIAEKGMGQIFRQFCVGK